MSKTTKKILREEYERLKKVMNRLFKPDNQKKLPSLVLQPVRHKKYLRGAGRP